MDILYKPKEKIYRLHEAAEILAVSVQTLRRWDNDKKIHCLRTMGNQRRIPQSELDRIQLLYKKTT